MIKREPLRRHHILLPESLSQRLKALVSEPGSSQTQIVTDALIAFLDRGAGSDIDERYTIRLDRLSRQLFRCERRLSFVSEALGLFIQHYLTEKAHDPPFEAATAHLGRRRYEAFLEMVWQRMGPLARSETESSPAGSRTNSADA